MHTVLGQFCGNNGFPVSTVGMPVIECRFFKQEPTCPQHHHEDNGYGKRLSLGREPQAHQQPDPKHEKECADVALLDMDECIHHNPGETNQPQWESCKHLMQ